MDRRLSTLFDNQNRRSYNETYQLCKSQKYYEYVFELERSQNTTGGIVTINMVKSMTFTGKKSTMFYIQSLT